ncbi:MAG: hypothetical protein DMG27_05145, partial [Acidobacteria bacterium]
MLLVAWVAAGMMWNIPGGGPTYAVPVSSGNSLSSASGTEQNSATQPGRANPAVEARLVAAYGKLPLSFEANSGQADDSVKFLSHGRGYTVSLTATEAALCFGAPERCGTRSAVKDNEAALHRTAQPAGTLVNMKLVGANRGPRVSGLDRLPGTANYFIGSNPRNWRTRVATYAKVRYKSVYPGIDLIYYGNQAQLEYDFVVAPGADPKTIRLSLEGGGALKLDARGDLVLGGKGEEIRFHRPRFYQERGSRQQQVPGRYVLRGSHQVEFRLASYDARRPLRIDPVLSYSTYLGGNNFDQPNGIVVDSAGNAYVAGFTSSSNFPAPSGALQATYAGSSDAFVSKLSPSGSSLVYSTYLGGSFTDQALAIALDSLGSAYIAGQTLSSDFPTTAGAFKTAYGGNGDAFLAKLSPDGSSLAYSTYLGGSGLDEARGIALDSSGNIYIAGQTFSTDFPMLSALQTANKGNQDAFVAEFSASGSLVYSTYLGGSGNDLANGIAVDALGDAYVTGYTNSADFPVSNAPQATCKSCPNIDDAFVAEIGANGSGIVYSTYLGGSGNDQGTGIAVDAQGNAYVTGFTLSSDFPATVGAYQLSLLGSADAFVTKVSANGSTLGYSTYLGKAKYSYGQAIAVLNGNAYVTGVTAANSNFPLINPTQPTRTGSPPDAFVTELNAAGSSLYFSTCLGGGNFDEATAIAVDPQANVYIAGQTKSTNFPSMNPFQAVYGGADSDSFITKILFATTATLSPTPLAFSNQQVGTGSAARTLTLSNTGTSPLTIMSLTISGSNSGDFSQTNNCGSTVAQGANCAINVTFTPTASGARSGAVTITDNASGSPQIANLTGAGIAPAVSLTPASVSFGNQQVGATSAAQAVTLTNTGTAALSITSIAVTGANSGDFAQTNTCPVSPATLAANGACTISVTFTPAASGARSGALTITDNASDSPEAVSLTGTGTAPGVSLAPASVSFGSQQVGSTSAAQAVTLSNTGAAPLSITSVGISGSNSGDFAQTNTCGTSVAAGGNCTISVTFSPTATGPRNGNVTVTDNAGDSPQALPVTGVGTGATPAVTFTGAPASAAYQSTFAVAATTNASTLPTITTSGPCSVSGVSGAAANASATITMTGGTGACSLTANWAPDSNYAAATATQSTAAAQVAPTVTFTGAPASAAYQSSFAVTSTTNASTTAVIAASGACTTAGNTVTMTSGTGACSLTANWAADNNYTSATTSQSTGAAKIAASVTFTGAPASAAY